MARITFSIPEPLAALAEQRAERERRSLSSYITLLVERDLAAAGIKAPVDAMQAEVLSYARAVGTKRALAALKSAARKRAA